MNGAAHPHQLRLNARENSYPNRRVEQEAIANIDQEVFERVRDYESIIVAASTEFLAEQKVHLDSAYEVAKMLDTEIRRPLGSGASSAEVIARYEDLRRRSESVKAALHAADVAAEYHEKRTDDPYAAMCAMWDRFPILRPHLGSSK